jgi:hypothetical protein
MLGHSPANYKPPTFASEFAADPKTQVTSLTTVWCSCDRVAAARAERMFSRYAAPAAQPHSRRAHLPRPHAGAGRDRLCRWHNVLPGESAVCASVRGRAFTHHRRRAGSSKPTLRTGFRRRTSWPSTRSLPRKVAAAILAGRWQRTMTLFTVLIPIVIGNRQVYFRETTSNMYSANSFYAARWAWQWVALGAFSTCVRRRAQVPLRAAYAGPPDAGRRHHGLLALG